MATTQRNEGEGNKTAAREYNEAQTAFAQSGKVKPAADAAKKALDGSEKADLKKAEEIGKAPGKDAPKI
jgi:hypothetical protein